jgi:hypothetical protein
MATSGTPNRHQVSEAEPLDVLEHQRREVEATLIGLQAVTPGGIQAFGQRAGGHAGGVRPRRVQDRAARAIDGPGRSPIQRPDEVRVQLVARAQVREPLPAAPDPERLPAELAGPVHDALDDRVQSRDVAAASEDADACHWPQ